MRSVFAPHSDTNPDLGAAGRGAGRLRLIAIAAASAALAAAVPSTASAQPPTRITIVAVFEPITYGENAYVNGQLIGDAQAGQLVTLEQSPPPFTDWTATAQITADAQGYYSFKLHPSQIMQYRTSSQGTPSDHPVQIDVAPRITLKASAAGKSSIRFSGTFAPALDGQSVAIQRRDSGGSWTTVTNARLHGGRTFEGRLRAHKPTTLRAFFATDGAHLDGYSSAVKVVPGAKARSARAASVSCAAPRIARVATTPATLHVGNGFTLRVRAAMSGGKLYAVDVGWGEGSERDHLTLAPGFRKPRLTFVLRHRYKAAGKHRLTIRAYGAASGCRRASATARPTLTVAP
jgi:hypothetical protein